MPPIDPKVGLTPWWVRFFIRIVEIVTTTDKLNSLGDKDKKSFNDSLSKLNKYLEDKQWK